MGNLGVVDGPKNQSYMVKHNRVTTSVHRSHISDSSPQRFTQVKCEFASG